MVTNTVTTKLTEKDLRLASHVRRVFWVSAKDRQIVMNPGCWYQLLLSWWYPYWHGMSEGFACGKDERSLNDLGLNGKESLCAGFVSCKHFLNVLKVNGGLPGIVYGHRQDNLCMQNECCFLDQLYPWHLFFSFINAHGLQVCI